jgi:uncharacterized protein
VIDPPVPALSAEELAAFARGVREFNAGSFFECHDTLEDVWSGVRGPARDFFQGLIQVSVALYHLSRGNLPGAESLLTRALGRFQEYGAVGCWGFDLEGHRAELRVLLERVRVADVGVVDAARLPKWRFPSLPAGRAEGDPRAAGTGEKER